MATKLAYAFLLPYKVNADNDLIPIRVVEDIETKRLCAVAISAPGVSYIHESPKILTNLNLELLERGEARGLTAFFQYSPPDARVGDRLKDWVRLPEVHVDPTKYLYPVRLIPDEMEKNLGWQEAWAELTPKEREQVRERNLGAAVAAVDLSKAETVDTSRDMAKDQSVTRNPLRDIADEFDPQ